MRLPVKLPAPFMNNLFADLLHFMHQQANASLVEMTKVIFNDLQNYTNIVLSVKLLALVARKSSL